MREYSTNYNKSKIMTNGEEGDIVIAALRTEYVENCKKPVLDR